MQILNQFEDFKDENKPIVLTIGNFDGVHRGHLSVIRRLQEIASDKSQSIVITFSNHPSEILRPQHPIQLLCSLPHRLKLIEKCGINTLILIPFTKHLAQHSAASFVERLRQSIPFTHLILGHDATLGRDRQGNRTVMKDLGQDWGFEVHYLEEYRFEGHPVSSSRIRELLQTGNLERVESLLGRPYSIYSRVVEHGSTINLEIKGLCLPPFGVYSVQVKFKDALFAAIANLNLVPIFGQNPQPKLEVQLLDPPQNFHGQEIEVIFQQVMQQHI
jgi:riboflavin kinase/FMN adenylyltransferase